MDARQRLRRYLEDRRDLGESELVLDSMTVEDALRTIGAIRAGSISGPPDRSPQTVTPTPDQSSQARNQTSESVDPDSANEAMEPADPPSGTTSAQSLESIARTVEDCTRCALYKTATRGVPGDGPLNARLVCVGEAPGANEDVTGHPFVGAAGNLLTKILAAVDLTRDEVFITNVVKHRPPGNRNPAPVEIAACNPFLVTQLELIRPKVIVAFGTFAAQTLLNTKTPIGKLRGEVHRYHGIPLVVTYHPAALLRNPAWKRPTWEDVKLARRILDGALGA